MIYQRSLQTVSQIINSRICRFYCTLYVSTLTSTCHDSLTSFPGADSTIYQHYTDYKGTVVLLSSLVLYPAQLHVHHLLSHYVSFCINFVCMILCLCNSFISALSGLTAGLPSYSLILVHSGLAVGLPFYSS